MVRIAICDDEKNAVNLHEDIVKNSLQACGIGYEITTYIHSRNLLCDIIDDNFFYDLILLDIEMPDVTGMELSEKIKPYLPNVKIIFITSHVEYAIDAFELSIFRYVPKNNLKVKLTAAVTDAAKLIELEAGQEYTIQTTNRLEKIPYKDIFYIQRDGKNVSIVSSAGTSKVRKSLQQVFNELNTSEFIFIDRGHIVNIIQIMKVSDGMAVLKNGEQLPISRSHLQEVKRQINQFWGAHI
ncbi:MAG: LytTR family DNA-binding domain-containing protein [Clostridia bacterium]|nr:LytTR family DNA-binding domain-containing protein [Lachnospiraceae bacterium]MCI7304452.1 LytTR family DNA-binding domain-containing protein [Clostridia bacterium]MDY2676765.1 LytTR family DNA-binding domain-containing protein [Phocaeicola vulgatus]